MVQVPRRFGTCAIVGNGPGVRAVRNPDPNLCPHSTPLVRVVRNPAPEPCLSLTLTQAQVRNGAVVDAHDAVFRFNAMRDEADIPFTGTKTTFRIFNRKRQVGVCVGVLVCVCVYVCV